MVDGLQEIKDEIARNGTRLDNVEGYFSNFDTTLSNHMTSYDQKLDALRGKFVWGFWVIFSLLVAALGGLIAGAVALLIKVM